MKKRKRFIQAVCVLLAFLMVLSFIVMIVSPGYADGSDQIQGEIDALSSQQSEIQSRMDEIQAEIDSLDYEKANTLQKKEYLDRKNMLAQQELDVIQEQVDIIDGKISSIQTDLAAAREEETRQRDLWLARLRAMEENSSVGYLEVLFNATSFSDLLTRLDLVQEVMSYDEQLESEYIEAREKAEALESEAEVMFQENAVRRQELEAKQSRLEADIAAACLLIEQMEQDSDDYAAVLEQEAQTQAMVQSLIVQKEQELAQARIEEEAARVAAQIAAEQAAEQSGEQQPPQQEEPSDQPPDVGLGDVVDASDTDLDSGGEPGEVPDEGYEEPGEVPDEGGEGSGDDADTDDSSSGSSGSASQAPSSSGTWMMWPSYTRYLTDRYGPRAEHPVTGEPAFHYGVDVGASYGSSIFSVANGTVIFAGQNGGYGNCVMVNHGNGYTTLYGHMSSISVSNGQSVSQGQVIGLVGATGRVTGPHLHFEVRNSSGIAMDPMSFGYF